MKFATILTAFSLVAFLGGCATKPQIEYDTSQMSAIRTIAVNVPKPTTYFAVSAGGPMFIPVPGVGLLAAAIGGAITGGVGAASTRTNRDFDSLVKEKVGDTGLNRKFIDALEAELRAQGYAVKEVDLAQDGLPKMVSDKTGLILKGEAYVGADAIMIAPDATGYFASGPAAPYVRSVKTEIRIFRADTLAPIFTQSLAYQKMQDTYSYNWYSALVGDVPHAVQGLDETLMGFVPEFRKALMASRGISETANTDGVRKAN